MELSTAGETAARSRGLKRTRVRLLTVFFMIYILVSGGSFGIEDMVSWSGPGLTILLLCVLPILWSLPMALVASELGSALPGEGGFYIWARRGLGDFWGFQTAWWWSLSIFVDSSVYVVLAVSYLQNWLDFGQLWFYAICWAVIAAFTLINIFGVKLVALSSTVFSAVIIAPFIVLIVVGLAKWQFNPLTPVTPPGVPFFGTSGALSLGLAIGVWMYSGYESMSTLSGEIREPQRVIPRALLLAVPFIIAMYVLPTIAGLAGYGNWDTWATQAGDGYLSFVEIGKALGGSALGVALLASALLGNLALYLDYLASGARPLFALSADRLFPASASRVSRRYGTPVTAIVLMARAQRGPHHRAVPEPRRDRRHPVHGVVRADLHRRGGIARQGTGPQAAVPRAAGDDRHGAHGRAAHRHRVLHDLRQRHRPQHRDLRRDRLQAARPGRRVVRHRRLHRPRLRAGVLLRLPACLRGAGLAGGAGRRRRAAGAHGGRGRRRREAIA